MPKPPPKPPFEVPETEELITDPLAREALVWLAYLHSGRETPEDWIAFDEWQAASADHARAGRRARRVWDQIGQSLIRQHKSRQRKLPVAIIAAIGLSALAFWAGLFGEPASFFADHRSSTGELRSVVLRDGSEVTLDTGTSFDVADGDRTITLYTGQVFVQVKADPSRPFTVISGNSRTTALGTAFAVRHNGSSSSVVVTESAVQVTDGRGTLQDSVRVEAGNAVTLERGRRLGDPQPADVQGLTAWRYGELRFVNRPLWEVVAEVDRYRRGKIVIVGGSIGDLPVRATVDIRKVDQFLASLEVVLPVTVLRLPGLVTITPSR
jgi:transmembrane sensor